MQPSLSQIGALAETSRQFTAVFNAVCAYGWQHSQKNSIQLHRALYYPLKADYPDLVSDLHIQARMKATEAVRSTLALRRAAERSANRTRQSAHRKRMQARRRTKTKRRMHSWSFAQLKGFIAYKAEERGCTVVAVDPRHTSQRCRCCGHRARTNRRSQSVFICRQCGYHLNADLNAARNIAAKYRADGGKPAVGGLHVNQPIVSNSLPLASA